MTKPPLPNLQQTVAMIGLGSNKNYLGQGFPEYLFFFWVRNISSKTQIKIFYLGFPDNNF